MNKPSAYVYKVTNKETGDFYIGSRTAKIVREKRLPEEDFCVYYFTSNSILKRALKLHPEKYNVEIIFRSNDTVFNERSGENEWVAYWAEQKLIKEAFNSPLCMNKNYHDHITGAMGYFASRPRTLLEKNNLSEKMTDKAVMYDGGGNKYNVAKGTKEINGIKLYGNQRGKSIYVDCLGNGYILSKNDEKIKNLKLTPIQRGKSVYKDADGNSYNLKTNDSRIKELNLHHANLGKRHPESVKEKFREIRKGEGNSMFGRINEVCCFDINTKEFKRVPKHVFDSTESLIGANSNEAKNIKNPKRI